MQPFVGQLLLVGFNFAPQGWMMCQGQLLPIAGNDTLFVLLGTTYGGDGQQTFGLPDLRGRTAIHQGTSPISGTPYTIGETGGVEQVTLTVNQLPTHNHVPGAAGSTADNVHASGSLLGDGVQIYKPGAGTSALQAGTIGTTGGSQPHTNIQPYLALNWIISLFGIFPSQG